MIVAILPPGDPRGETWDKLFHARRIPVKGREPLSTILPDGARADCYFVDFDQMPAEQVDGFLAVARRAHPVIQQMVSAGMYPIRAENVTIAVSQSTLWK